jgi:hypothetical protein
MPRNIGQDPWTTSSNTAGLWMHYGRNIARDREHRENKGARADGASTVTAWNGREPIQDQLWGE